MKHILTAIVAAAIALLAVPAANATADGCAVVRKTPDGFLNLRQAPTAKALAIARIKPSWHLSIDSASCQTSGAVAVCNGDEWTHVISVWPIDGGPDNKSPTQGWVATRFLKFIECPD